MLAIIRTIAALTDTVEQALSIAGIMVLAIANYAGYSIPRSSMKPWFKWISYINPVGPWSKLPNWRSRMLLNRSWPTNLRTRMCLAHSLFRLTRMLGLPIRFVSLPVLHFQFFLLIEGSVPGQETVSGATWLQLSYGYTINNLWRNFGIIVAFFFFFMVIFLVTVEFKNPPPLSGEVLVFLAAKEPPQPVEANSNRKAADVESGQKEPSRLEAGTALRTTTTSNVEAMKKDLQAPQDIFTWRNVCCDVHIKGETRRLLSNVSGYVKPGTLTALMGESGAGKTTLLDTSLSRASRFDC